MARTKPTKIVLPLLEDPSEGNATRAACVKCELHTKCKTPWMAAYVPDNWTGAILVLAEAPGVDEDKQGRPMVGKAGQFLFNDLLAGAGVRPEDVAITNANRCWPGPGNPAPSLSQVRLCRPFAAHDIVRLRPKWLLVMGDNAARAVLNANEGVKRRRQRAYDASEFFGGQAEGIKVCFTYHPASCFYQNGAEQKQRIKEDLAWLMGFKGYTEPPRAEVPEIVEGEDEVGVDIEWNGNHELLTVGQAVGDRAVATESKETWTNWLEGWSIPGLEPTYIGHSTFGDLAVLALNGMKLPPAWITGEKSRCSLLLARLENENRGAYDLESLSTSLAGMAPWKSRSDSIVGKGKNRQDFSVLSPEIRIDRCRLDASASLKVANAVGAKSNSTVVAFVHQLAALLQRMEMAGVKINQDRYQQLGSIIQEQLGLRTTALKTFAASRGMENFEISNDGHFRTLLYDKLGAKVDRLTEKDKLPSIDKDTLVLTYQTGTPEIREAVNLRLRCEKADKLYSTYIGRPNDDPDGGCGLASRLTKDFFVFQEINPLGARTGRRSSHNPNMQNWPKRLRAMATSRFPNGRIVKGDESQLEPRILAHLAGIDEWQDLFARGDNLYLYTAKRLWKKDVDKESSLYRMTKATILGTNYGMEEDLFMERMAVDQGIILTREQARFLLNGYHSLYPQLPRYFARMKEILLRYQAVATMTGQIRRLPCPNGEKTPGFKHLWNQAVNFPVQGLAAYVTGSAALDLETALLARSGVTLSEHYSNLVRFWGVEKLNIPLDNPSFRGILEVGREIDYPVLVNEVHDELVVDSPEKDAKWVAEVLEEVMATCPTLRQLWPSTKSLLLKADIATGLSWGDG